MVNYPHHPLAGQRICVIRTVKYADIPHFVVQGPDNCRALLPAWMAESHAAALPFVDGAPRLSIDALQTLCRLVAAQPLSPSTILPGGGGGDGALSTTERPTRFIGVRKTKTIRPNGSRRSKRPSQAPHHRVRNGSLRGKRGKR